MYKFDFYQNMLTLIVILVSYIFVFIVSAKHRKDTKMISVLFIWHILFSLVYYSYTLINASDAEKYYLVSLTDNLIFYPGSPFVYYLTSIFSKGLNASYLNATLFYNIFGTLGLVLLYKSIRQYLKNLSWYWSGVVFIPSMSFWSAGLGKDAISFLATCLFLYAITDKKSSYILIFISFFLMFMVRPHIAAIMLVSYIVYFIIQARLHLIFKIIALPIIGLGLFLSIGFVQQYIGLEEASLNSVTDYIDGRQELNLGRGSSVDIASMSYPMQIFTYVFRPLPFEAHNAVALITSLENTILLFLFLYILVKSKFNFRPFIQGKNLWLFTYALLTCSILAMTTANLGIATRQKWMFMPVLLYLLIYVYHDYKSNKSKGYQ